MMIEMLWLLHDSAADSREAGATALILVRILAKDQSKSEKLRGSPSHHQLKC